MMDKDRSNSDMTWEKVRSIRKMAKENFGKRHRDIGYIFHVTAAVVSNIVSYRSWRDDPELRANKK